MRILLCLVLVASIAMLSGCANIIYRTPGDPPIKHIYEPTRLALGTAIIVAFPQAMSDAPSDYNSFQSYNLLTIPLGVLVLCDAAAEFCLDTIFLPYDICQ